MIVRVSGLTAMLVTDGSFSSGNSPRRPKLEHVLSTQMCSLCGLHRRSKLRLTPSLCPVGRRTTLRWPVEHESFR
jgi:hypothetical protein